MLIYWHSQFINKMGVCLQEVRLTSICRNRCPHASPGRLRTSGFSQARLLLLYFHCFYAGARSLLSVRFELSLQGIPHCFCTDLGEPDVAESSLSPVRHHGVSSGACQAEPLGRPQPSSPLRRSAESAKANPSSCRPSGPDAVTQADRGSWSPACRASSSPAT